MTHGPAWLPLDIVDLAGGVARTIAGAAQRTLVTGADEVLVVVAARAMPGAGRRLRCDGTASAIWRALEQVAGASAVLLPVPADGAG
jgi:hypothetical protein